jgi:hypothetical protein
LDLCSSSEEKKPMHNVRDNNPSFHHIHVAEGEVEEEKGSC